MQVRDVVYQDGEVTCRGFMAFDEKAKGPRPGILIAPGFDGLTEFSKSFAEKVAKSGYVAFCVDMFGDGKTATDFDGCMALIQPFFDDRGSLQARILAAFRAAQAQPEIDENHLAAMGFCFGGLTALDLARAGADVKGVVTFHGNFTPPPAQVKRGRFTAKVLMLHGYDDPQVTPAELSKIADELNAQEVDWQFVYFSQTKHAFMEPKAGDIGQPKFGRVYNERAAHRAWQYAQQFFDELFQ